MKKTIVIGASENTSRYSNMAVKKLIEYGYEVVPLGIKNGKIGNLEIITNKPKLVDIDTITLYVGEKKQVEWIDYILTINPKRLIFNPGTENKEFIKIAKDKGIEVKQACTLVMLDFGQF